jgi:hypothetical protein
MVNMTLAILEINEKNAYQKMHSRVIESCAVLKSTMQHTSRGVFRPRLIYDPPTPMSVESSVKRPRHILKDLCAPEMRETSSIASDVSLPYSLTRIRQFGG